MTVREDIEKYILQLTNERELGHSMNLFESGFLTSIDVLDLICFIEETYNIDISDDDIGMENFGSIDGLVNFVERVKQLG